MTPAQPLVADTHVVLWYLTADDQLSPQAREALRAAAEPVAVSAVSLVELRYAVEKGSRPDAVGEDAFAEVDRVLEAQVLVGGPPFRVVPVDAAVARAVARIPREAHKDPWDRMIAATALVLGRTLVTADHKLRAWPGLPTLW